MKKMKLLFSLTIVLLTLSVSAQDLVYKPRNPAFGGDTFNYQWLASSAESQNKFKETSTAKTAKTDLEKFADQLNSHKAFRQEVILLVVYQLKYTLLQVD